MKNLLLLCTVVTSVLSFQEMASASMCRRWYSNDIFQTYLNMSIESPDSPRKPGGYVLWMDRHIPYGIRPFPYLVTQINCTSPTSLSVQGKSAGGVEPVEFLFTAADAKKEWQPGSLTYFNAQGDKIVTWDLECSLKEIQDFCGSLKK